MEGRASERFTFGEHKWTTNELGRVVGMRDEVRLYCGKKGGWEVVEGGDVLGRSGAGDRGASQKQQI